MSYHIQLLASEFESRKRKNARYSLRAFAKFLEIDPSALSRIVRGKQELSIEGCVSVLKKIPLSPSKQRLFVRSVLCEKARVEYVSISRRLEWKDLGPPRATPVEAGDSRAQELLLTLPPGGRDGVFFLAKQFLEDLGYFFAAQDGGDLYRMTMCLAPAGPTAPDPLPDPAEVAEAGA